MLLLALLELAAVALALEEAGFDYAKNALGPRQWGCLAKEWRACRSGSMQSPIPLKTRYAIDACELGTLDAQFSLSYGSLVQQPYTYKIMIQAGPKNNTLVVDGIHYNLQQFHFHHPSEHTIDGKRFALEMHLVYQAETSLRPLVIAQMYKPGEPDPVICQALGTTGSIDLQDLKLGVEYFRYVGSLTTPPCTENVTWTVMSTVKTASKQQIRYLRQHLRGHNARPLQRLNHRKVHLFAY